MAIFTSDNKQFNGKEGSGATIIAVGTKIKGEINIECHFHIDGEFEGTIRSKNTVMIGKSGIVKGDIYAQKLIISGKLIGNTESKSVEIAPFGRFEGNITADEFVIERKGVFVGESKNTSELKLLNSDKVNQLKDDSKK